MGTRSPARFARLFGLVAAVLVIVTLAACSNADDSADGERGDSAGTDSPEGTTEEAASGELKVLTYNVAGLPQEVSEENPRDNIPKVSKLLAGHDLVLTQEDFDWWLPGGLASGLDFVNYHDRLLADADYEYALDPHPGNDAVGITLEERPFLNVGDGIGILSTRPLVDQRRVPWTECFGGIDGSDQGAADCLSMKGFAVATMDLEGAEVDVYSLHGEAGGSDRDQELQAADFEQLAAFIDEHSEGRAVILGGDTNLHLDAAHEDSNGDADTVIWERFLAVTGLTDACVATECDDMAIIDKIAVRGSDDVELSAESWESPSAEFVDEEGQPLSDHDPVRVVVSYRVD